MLPKYQQNLATIKDYIKSHDLRIRCSAITARYSTSDENSVLRFMVLASVLENDSFAFSKFSRYVANGDKLEACVRRFVREVALDVSELPRVSATVDSSGDMLVKLKILKRSAGEVGTTLTLFHGSPYSNVDVSEAPLLYYTANIEIARDYALGTVAFTGKPPKGVRTEHGPTVYKVKAAGLHVFDFRRTDHQELYQQLREDFNKRLTEDENDSRLPRLASEGFISHRTGLPSYGRISVLIPLIQKRHFDAIWIDEGSQGTSLAIFNPRKVQLQERVQLKPDYASYRTAIGSRQSGSISISRMVDPRLMSDKVIRRKVSDLAKLVVQAHKHFANYTTSSQSYFDEAARELNYLLATATYRTSFLYIQQKVRHLLDAVEDDFAEYAYKQLGIREQDLNEVAADASSLEYLMENEPDEPETKAFHDWARLLEFKKKAEEKLQYFDTIQKSVTMESTETLFHASLYASDLAKNGWSAAGDRTGLGAFGKQHTVSFTYSLVYAQQLFQFFIAAWMVANKKMSVDRVAALFKTKRETYHKPVRADLLFDTSLLAKDKYEANLLAKDKYEAKDQGLNEFLNFVRMHEIGVNFLAVFNQETLYKQLRSIPVTSIGIVKCVVETEGAEHVPGEWEIRVMPEAIQSTVLVTKGSG